MINPFSDTCFQKDGTVGFSQHSNDHPTAPLRELRSGPGPFSQGESAVGGCRRHVGGLVPGPHRHFVILTGAMPGLINAKGRW